VSNTKYLQIIDTRAPYRTEGCVQSMLDVIDFCVYGCVWLYDWDMYDSLKHLIVYII